MTTESTNKRIFEVLDDIRDRLARVETTIEAHYVQNQQDHNNLTAIIEELKTDVKDLEKNQDEQQTVLDARKGQHSIFSGMWQFILAMISGGIMLALGGWLAKMIGILR